MSLNPAGSFAPGCSSEAAPRASLLRYTRQVIVLICLSFFSLACGQSDPGRGSETDGTRDIARCLRDSGAMVEELPGRGGAAPRKTLQVSLPSRESGAVLVYDSEAQAERVVSGASRRRSAAMVRGGRLVAAYNGRSGRGAQILEDCLRASAAAQGHAGPERGELAREAERVEQRRQAFSAQYRNRQYNAPDELREQLTRLRSYGRYTLYYLGERHAGHELTALTSRLQPVIYGQSTTRMPKPTSPTFDFIYGDCRPPPGSEGGCPPPIAVQNYEICARNPNGYGVPARTLTARIRGVPYYMNEGAGAFELYTGTTTVVIFANDWSTAKRAAEELRSIDGRIGPRSPLPAPISGALEGRLRCQPPPAAD